MPEQKDTNPNRDRDSAGKGKPRENGSGGNGGGNGGRGPQPPRNGNFMSRGILGWVLLGGLAIALLLLMNQQQNQGAELSWQSFYNIAQRDNAFAEPVEVRDTQVIGILTDEAAEAADNPPNKRIYTAISSDTKNIRVVQLEDAGVEIKEVPGTNALWTIFLYWGPVILIILLVYFFVFRSLRNAGGGPGGMLGNFARSKHKVMNKEHSTIRLNDVAGIEEAKDEVNEIIEFLKNPKKFQRLGGRVPRGVLLIGSPGCGKTLLAKAVAGEAEVPFFSISGSDFVEMFVGVGASRVRDLFKQAKESSPCIIFLDEIDAVGRKRGSGFSSGGHDEREQTLNAILVEMDGFDSSDQIIVMAATNRADVLDPALTRPGRFDRQIHVTLPDIKGRMEILKVHSRKIKISPDVNLERLARGTPMFSGADLAAIINEAAIIATMQGKEFVEQDDLEEARDKVKWGRSRKSHKIEEDEKKVIAYHEAGHAVVMYYDENSEPLHKVTIIPRGQALGSTFMLPEKDKHIISKKQLMAQMRVCFGGRIAEEMFTGDQYNGTAGDIRQASAIARAMVTEYGMSDRMGFLLYGSDDSQQNPWGGDRTYSDDTARMIDEEVKGLIDQTYRETKDLIKTHGEQLDALAKALLKYETLTYDEVKKIMDGETLDKATVSELLEAERDKARETDDGKTVRPDTPGLDNDTPGAWPTPA